MFTVFWIRFRIVHFTCERLHIKILHYEGFPVMVFLAIIDAILTDTFWRYYKLLHNLEAMLSLRNWKCILWISKELQFFYVHSLCKLSPMAESLMQKKLFSTVWFLSYLFVTQHVNNRQRVVAGKCLPKICEFYMQWEDIVVLNIWLLWCNEIWSNFHGQLWSYQLLSLWSMILLLATWTWLIWDNANEFMQVR